jgi:ketosteroid isomerase-like protein
LFPKNYSHDIWGDSEVDETANQKLATTLIAMERAALDRWSKGDTTGFLEISAPDVLYFDPFLDRRIDREELNRYYHKVLQGKVADNGYEMIDPKVQKFGNIAILSYNCIPHNPNKDKGRNVTEVYRKDGDRWQIVHTHVSFKSDPPTNLPGNDPHAAATR